jgi:hypothetical protein
MDKSETTSDDTNLVFNIFIYLYYCSLIVISAQAINSAPSSALSSVHDSTETQAL